MKSTAIGEEATTSATAGRVAKRVVLSMGGKGGVGIMPPAGLCRIESASPNSNGSAGVFEAA
jgi:hypothetical protein